MQNEEYPGMQRRNKLPDIHFLLGDFNMVEDESDQYPIRPDNKKTVEALWDLKDTLRISNGWQWHYPILEKGYTFVQAREANQSMSRIDRIYMNEETLQSSSNWAITKIGWTNHLLLTCKIEAPNIPRQGKGRWSLPVWLVDNKTLIEDIEKKGNNIINELKDPLFQRKGNDNPQTCFEALINHIQKSAKAIQSALRDSLKKELEIAQKEYSAIINSKGKHQSNSNETREELGGEILKTIVQLEKELAERNCNRGSAKHRAMGEVMGKYWSKFGNEVKTREAIQALQVETPEDDNRKKYTQESKEMAEVMRNYHEHVQLNDLDLNADIREATIEKAIRHIKRPPQYR